MLQSQLQPQYQQFSVWRKTHLIQGHPCIIAAYVNDADNDPDYDHIMPTIGISYYEPTSSYNPKDKLLCYNLYQLKILERELSTNDIIKQRQTCNKSTLLGGCLPYNADYGYAIFGIVDKQNVILPLRLKVDRSDEPNLSLGASPVQMQDTITVFNLVLGRNYVLLRYKSYTEVPSSGNATAFLSSRYYKRHTFRATNVINVYVDPEKILSNGTTYYRCVCVS
ncbi:unnamed protein product [Rotaria magnacalcarata]|uniref:Uncharacterized protein n=2 Tax=Rotaria magnacalcarata TaxID=392030 RepID=A0A820A871_9BILA|nr:unnamed protein product [Rotaria magnacalcarata]